MSDRIELRGYAAPILYAERVGNVLEYFDAGAFDDAVSARQRPILNVYDHATKPIGQVCDLFVDEVGLGFRAFVAPWTWRAIQYDVTRGETHRCSVGMHSHECKHVRHDGILYRVITKASLDEITITATPAYSQTAIWPALVNGPMPQRLARLAQSWRSGFAAHQLHRVEADSAAARKARQSPPKHRGSVAAMLAGREQQFERFRERIAASIAAGHHRPSIICHAAFTKRGGFDRQKFERQIAAAQAHLSPLRAICVCAHQQRR